MAAFTVIVAAGCHLAAGGMVGPLWTLGLVGAPAVPLCYRLSRRRWTVRELVAVFVLAQAVMHLTCTLGVPMAGGGPVLSMLGAHATATVASVLLVRRGEDGLHQLFETLLLLRPVRHLVVASPVPAATPGAVVSAAPDLAPVRRCFLVAEPTRGPPMSV